MRALPFYASVAAILLAPSGAWAQEAATPLDIPPGPDQIVPLDEGAPAPFAGQLFSDPTALRWANWLRQYKAYYVIDMEAEKKLRQIERSAAEARFRAYQEHERQLVEAYEKRLETPPPVAWYNSFWFGAAVGVVGAGTLVAFGAWATN